MLVNILVQYRSDGSHFNTLRTIKSNQCYVGRTPGSGLVIDDPRCSRLHAVLFETRNGELAIRDLSSEEGTRVAGVRIKYKTLREGDCFMIGDTKVTILAYATSDFSPEPQCSFEHHAIAE